MSARLLVVVLSSSACLPPVLEPLPVAVPSAGRLTLECETHSVFAWNPDRTLSPGNRVRCFAHVADRFGTPLSGVRVQLLSEAGSLSVTEGVTDGGVLETELVVGLPAPVNVKPGVYSYAPDAGPLHTGAPLAPAWMGPLEWTISGLTKTRSEPARVDPMRRDAGLDNNPRDQLVTLIAVVDGEEAFSDDNANGFREPVESFVDLTEPFVDADDDGTRGPAEGFVDGNANGTWEGKNQSWDSATKIWAVTHVLWTGLPAAIDVAPPGGTRASVVTSPIGPLALSCSNFGIPCTASRAQRFNVSIADPWLNGITRTRLTDGCTVLPTDSRFSAKLAWGPDSLIPEVPGETFVMVEVHDERLARNPSGMIETATVRLHCDFTDGAGTTRSFEFDAMTIDLY